MDVWLVEKIITYSNENETSKTIEVFSSLENAIEYIKKYDYCSSFESELFGNAEDDLHADRSYYYIRTIYPENKCVERLSLFVSKNPKKIDAAS